MRKKSVFLVTNEDILEEEEGPASGAGPDGYEYPKSSRDDERLAAELVALIEDELGLNLKRIQLRVVRSKVYLQGTVETREQREKLQAVLERQPAVRSVESFLTVAATDRE